MKKAVKLHYLRRSSR